MAHPPPKGPTPHYRSHVTPHTTLPSFHFRTSGDHREELRPDMRRRCWYCRYKKVHGDPKNPPLARERARVLALMGVSQTSVWCPLCDLPLCKTQGCYHDFHTV